MCSSDLEGLWRRGVVGGQSSLAGAILEDRGRKERPENAGETSQQRKQEHAGVGSGSWGVMVAVCNGEQGP